MKILVTRCTYRLDKRLGSSILRCAIAVFLVGAVVMISARVSLVERSSEIAAMGVRGLRMEQQPFSGIS
jgi:hypothetical protein